MSRKQICCGLGIENISLAELVKWSVSSGKWPEMKGIGEGVFSSEGLPASALNLLRCTGRFFSCYGGYIYHYGS